MTPVAPQGRASTRRGYEWAVKSAADAAKDWRALLSPLEGEGEDESEGEGEDEGDDKGTRELGEETYTYETAPCSPTAALADGDTAVGTAAPRRVWQRFGTEGARSYHRSELRVEITAANRKRSHDFMDSLGGGPAPNV